MADGVRGIRRTGIIASVIGLLTTTHPAPAAPVYWDPDFNLLGIVYQEAVVTQGTRYWRLVEGYADDPVEGGGKINIFYKGRNLAGNFEQDLWFRTTWPGGSADGRTKAPPEFGDFPMSGGNWCPATPPGPFSGMMLGRSQSNPDPSDRVIGMGLPCNQHWSFRLFFEETIAGSSTPPPGDVLVPAGSTWRYLDSGVDLGVAWRDPSFNDAAWAAGPAQLGYGDGDEATVVSFGTDASNKHVTTYFRHAFNVDDPARLTDITLHLLRDDGAAVYLNGVEVARANLPVNPAFNTFATATVGGADEQAFYPFSISADRFVAGNNVLAVEVHQVNRTSSDLSFDLELTATILPPPPPPTGDLVLPGATWRYLDNGSDQGTAWRQPAFNDSAWAQGPAQLGYGEGDEATVVSFGGNASNKFPTTYFRHAFDVADASRLSNLELELLFDDGAAVYLNGTEIARRNLAPNAAYNAFATATIADVDENVFVPFPVPDGLLVTGRNVLAVEVHQVNATSSDISFDLKLTGELDATPPPPPPPPTPLPDGYIVHPIQQGDVWRYQADGVDRGDAWIALTLNDADWPQGNAQLGYGDGDETTVIPFGPDAQNKYPTTYFRRSFNLDPDHPVLAMQLQLLVDDGAAVYLNGFEIARINLADGADFGDYALSAVAGSDESIYHLFNVPTLYLNPGLNVLAVEVHQSDGNSSDLSFDAELLAVIAPLPGDLDLNGIVAINDLARLAVNFGVMSGAKFADGDIDGDGAVTIADLAQLATHFGASFSFESGAAATSIPEPATLGAFALLLFRRRRSRRRARVLVLFG